ncbi:MAG: Rieske 2Fe-2S domain-containing protein, partial [Planctomycetota bacterium]|nr:Rieske 2Fe-2S domain-containing protein [Planctomycetota bacterium]
MTYSTTDLGELIRDHGVNRRVYTDPEIFELEMQRIWGRAWLYVAHESQIPDKGSYFTTTLAQQAVLLVRHDDNTFYVFFNRCAHKGSKVIEHESGRAPALRCGYHGWTYETDGRCKHVTGGDAAYNTLGIDKTNSCMGLQKVPSVDSYRGFIFASLSPDAPDLKTWLGATATSIDNLVDRSPEGKLEITGGVLRYN